MSVSTSWTTRATSLASCVISSEHRLQNYLSGTTVHRLLPHPTPPPSSWSPTWCVGLAAEQHP
jgi:hypothetical protein